MAEERGRSLSWPTILVAIGAVSIILGAILLSSQSDTIDEIYDPRNAAIATISSDGNQLVELEKDHCYIAYHISGKGGVETSLTPVDGSSANGEPIESSSCLSDWIPMTSDGTNFAECEDCRWKSESSGEAVFASVCDVDECQDSDVYLIHVDDVEYQIFQSVEMVLGFGICCLGIMLLPIAGIVAYSNRANKIQRTVFMVGPDGTVRGTDNPDMLETMGNGTIPIQGPVGGPFAETGVSENPDYVDGSMDVMQGKLLTTEQVYSLMRGDVEEAVSTVDDPFADSKPRSRVEIPKREVNTEQISQWDAGDSGIQPKPKTQTKTVREPRNLKKTDEGKNWDDWDKQ